MPRPPAPPPHFIPGAAQITLHWSTPDGVFSNVYHAQYGGTPVPSGTLAETLFSGIKAAAGTVAWLGIVSTDVALERLSFKDLRTAENPIFESSSGAVSGNDIGGRMPINAALVVTLRTDRSGRQWRGRSYLGGLTSTSIESMKRWLDSAGTVATAFVSGIDGVFTTNGMPMGLAQPRLMAGTDANGNDLPERAANIVDVVRFEIANPRIDTQRRRLGR
jgi:hypothetical protein